MQQKDIVPTYSELLKYFKIGPPIGKIVADLKGKWSEEHRAGRTTDSFKQFKEKLKFDVKSEKFTYFMTQQEKDEVLDENIRQFNIYHGDICNNEPVNPDNGAKLWGNYDELKYLYKEGKRPMGYHTFKQKIYRADDYNKEQIKHNPRRNFLKENSGMGEINQGAFDQIHKPVHKKRAIKDVFKSLQKKKLAIIANQELIEFPKLQTQNVQLVSTSLPLLNLRPQGRRRSSSGEDIFKKHLLEQNHLLEQHEVSSSGEDIFFTTKK